MERLKGWLSYAELSPSQLRRMVLKALDDPRTAEFLEAEFHPPVDEPLGEELKGALNGVRQVLVIPSVDDLNAASNERFFWVSLLSSTLHLKFLKEQTSPFQVVCPFKPFCSS